MQAEDIVLFSPTHEQSLPSFHVQADLVSSFTAYLQQQGFELAEPNRALGVQGSHHGLVEVLVKAGTSLPRLDKARQDFLKSVRRAD